MVTPEEWVKTYHSRAYGYSIQLFQKFLDSKGLILADLIKDGESHAGKVTIRNLIDEFVRSRADKHTSKSLRTLNGAVRAYFEFNDISLPKGKVILKGERAPTVSRLTPTNLRAILSCGKLKHQSLLCFKYESCQDSERMVWINKHSWNQLKPQLLENGYRDSNGKLWEGFLRVDLLHGRKSNVQAYHTFVGPESVRLLKSYLAIRGEPRENELIWQNINKSISITKLGLRHAKMLGLLPKERGSTSSRYGVSPHEYRDLFLSLWDTSEANPIVGQFLSGHSIDASNYRKACSTISDFSISEYVKAYPVLNVLNPQGVNREEIERQKKTQEDQAKEIGKLRDYIQQISQEINFMQGKPIFEPQTRRREESSDGGEPE